ncbi:MAG: hypothetical protein GFH27_549397n13 [Chloroflexi bacterium AL-W]|nr:hypothetical protein [Chloroflexi bacterium AL-W]
MNAATLRKWAFAHPVSARWALAFSHIVLGLSMFCYGLFVVGTGLYEAQWPLWISLGILAGVVVLMIRWRGRAPSRKAWMLCHSVTIFTIATLYIILGSRFPIKYGGESETTVVTQVMASDQEAKVWFAAQKKASTDDLASPSSRKSKRALKRLIKRSQNSISDLPRSVKVLLSVLAYAMIPFLVLLTAIFSCQISCNGLPVLAVIVLILGLFISVGLPIFIVMKLWPNGGLWGNDDTRYDSPRPKRIDKY